MEPRFVRQLLLEEVGKEGQERLLDTGFRAAPSADPDAYAVASEYLHRAGCPEREHGRPLRGLSADAVDRLAGNPALRAQAAALLGAFEAVEHIKHAVRAGRPASLPPTLTLTKRGQSPFSTG